MLEIQIYYLLQARTPVDIAKSLEDLLFTQVLLQKQCLRNEQPKRVNDRHRLSCLVQ